MEVGRDNQREFDEFDIILTIMNEAAGDDTLTPVAMKYFRDGGREIEKVLTRFSELNKKQMRKLKELEKIMDELIAREWGTENENIICAVSCFGQKIQTINGVIMKSEKRMREMEFSLRNLQWQINERLTEKSNAEAEVEENIVYTRMSIKKLLEDIHVMFRRFEECMRNIQICREFPDGKLNAEQKNPMYRDAIFNGLTNFLRRIKLAVRSLERKVNGISSKESDAKEDNIDDGHRVIKEKIERMFKSYTDFKRENETFVSALKSSLNEWIAKKVNSVKGPDDIKEELRYADGKIWKLEKYMKEIELSVRNVEKRVKLNDD